jgi:DNA-binding response OmpR family regulator
MGVVLVVEDDPANAVLVETVLTRAGHRVLMASEGPSALDIARRWVPDLVLLDVSLAGSMSGFEVCRTLRADPVTAAVAVLMLSGWAFESDILAGQAAGADGYLAKPFGTVELRTRVQELIDRTPASAPGRCDNPQCG